MASWDAQKRQLHDEIAAHLDLETAANLDRGMTPEEARRAARLKFGNPAVTAEQAREVWGRVWLERLLQDIRYALRSFRAMPTYAATLICTLTLGLACVVTMLAIVESVLMRPVALPHADQLVQFNAQGSQNGTNFSDRALSYADIDALRRNTSSFAGISTYNLMPMAVTAADGTRIALVLDVSPDFFRALGASTRLGRTFSPTDAQAPVAVVSDEFWHTRLHGDPDVVGAVVRIGTHPHTVIGVLPAGFHIPQGTGGELIYTPATLNGKGEDDLGATSAATIARRKPGIGFSQAFADARRAFAHASQTQAARPDHLQMRPLQNAVVGDMTQPLWLLLGGVAVLLLISCANAANLQIGRATSRMPEMLVRSALGANFGRLLQQLVTESILVSMCSAVLGIGLAWAAVTAVRNTYGAQYPRFDEITIDPVTLLSAVVLAMLVGVLASLAPAISVRRQTLQGKTRTVTSRSKLPGILVAVQVALTCVLLVISGLLVRTLHSLANVSLGFDPHNVTTLVLMPENQQRSLEAARQTDTQLLHRFQALPGIQAVTMQTALPFSNMNMALDGTTEVQGRTWHEGDSAFYTLVSTDFVRTSGIHLLAGRSFAPSDEGSSAMVGLVNQAFVHKFFNGGDALGKQVWCHRKPGETDADQPFWQHLTVVGVVENEVQGGNLGDPYEPMLYIDYLQLPENSILAPILNLSAQYAVRSTLPPAAVATELRAAVKEEAPSMIEVGLAPMEDAIASSLGQRRLALQLVAGFGGVALFLSAVGIYGVLAYAVALRRREIGIRMALGSSRPAAAALVLRQAGLMLLFGLVPGALAAWLSGHAMRSFLFGVQSFDATTLLASGCILLLTSLLAALFPTLRAAQVEPMETLRAE